MSDVEIIIEGLMILSRHIVLCAGVLALEILVVTVVLVWFITDRKEEEKSDD